MVRDMKAMVKAVMATMTNILPMVAMKKAVMAVMVAVDTAQAVMAAVVTAQAVMAVAVMVKAVITVKREVLWAAMAAMEVMVRAMVAGDLMAVISPLFLALMDTTAEDSRGLLTLPNMDPTAMVAVGDGAASGATPITTSPGLDPCSTTRSSTMKPITWPIFWRSTVINQSMSTL